MQRTLSKRQGVAIFYNLKIIFPTEIFDEFPTPLLRYDDFSLGRRLHKCRQTAAMIGLDMINDYIVNLCGINNLTDSFEEFFGKRCFHRINQTDFLIHDQIRIVRNSSRGFIAMKITGDPVHRPNLINPFGKFRIMH